MDTKKKPVKLFLDKIDLIGFSAGGNEIGTFINVLRGKNFFPEGYAPDEIDSVDDGIASAAPRKVGAS